MGFQSDVPWNLEARRSSFAQRPWTTKSRVRYRVLIVENETSLRESLGMLLNERGYEVSLASNGSEALAALAADVLPDLIVLDLKMPVMDGWEFRSIQKDDPKLGLIPVLAISADSSPQAAAISAHGYLHKPFDSLEMMTAVERVLAENADRIAARHDETERLAALGRVAANVGHEINNPLAFLMLYLRQSLQDLGTSVRALGHGRALSDAEVKAIKAGLVGITEMLQDCEIGGERIRVTVANLQHLSHRSVAQCGSLDVQQLLEQSAAMAGNQIRHRARLTQRFGEIALVRGDGAALGQVFLNLLVNAFQSIPEGDAERNDIQVTTRIDQGVDGPEVMIQVSDTGGGMAPEVLSHVFEPYYTTKALGEGTGLGLSISRQTVLDHGGRMTVESEVGKGTSFRVFLPVDSSPIPARPPTLASELPTTSRRGRVLVVDDEPLIGRVLRAALKGEHEVVVVERAAAALALLNQGDRFDVVLCDLMMPDVSGPDFYERVNDRWPQLAGRVVFMTGGAFTPRAVEFMNCVPTSVLSKPFDVDELRRVVSERIRRDA
ncbi:MAG: Sensor protein [Myxococcales bacterium]|nr:Sensor protein [Myxococcales bacterium]